MKQLVFTIALFFLAMTVNGQSAVDKIFNKYAGKDGYTTVVINSFMFKLLADIDIDDPEYNSFKKASSGLESIRILTQDGNTSENFAKELLENLPRKEYEELMVVKEADEDVVFLVKEEDGIIHEFLLIVSSKDGEDALIVLTGKIDLETLSSLSSALDLPGMENLEDLE